MAYFAHGLSRRSVLGYASLAAALGGTNLKAALAPHDVKQPSPQEALSRLKRGNADFLRGKLPLESANGQRRLDIALSQHPFAVLVGCSDSRVPPGLLFGRGPGDLFIVRNAGNTIDTAAMGSIEYAVAELAVPLIVVMGHERCGAVAAAVEVVVRNATFPGSIGRMIEPIIPAVLAARSGGGDLLDASVRANVQRTVLRLKTASDPVIQGPYKAGALAIVGARYDLDDGHVIFFE